MQQSVPTVSTQTDEHPRVAATLTFRNRSNPLINNNIIVKTALETMENDRLITRLV